MYGNRNWQKRERSVSASENEKLLFQQQKKIKARRNKQIKGGAKEKGSLGILRSLSSLFTFLVRQSFWHVEKIRMVGGREKVCAAKNSFSRLPMGPFRERSLCDQNAKLSTLTVV